MKKILFGLAGIVVIGIGYYLISPLWIIVKVEDARPAERQTETAINPSKSSSTASMILARGIFKSQAHDVKGDGLVIQNGEDKTLRFENFKTINGPDLRIYLSADLDAKDHIDLGAIRGTEGNINYTIPSGTDQTKYKYVLVWCRAFHVLFSYALLQ